RRAAHRLHNAVSGARRMLERGIGAQSVIAFEDDSYVIAASAVLTDYDLFASSYRAGRYALASGDREGAAHAFRAALALDAGEYVADDPYASWTQPRRVHVSEQRLNALTYLCEHAAERGELVPVLEYAQRILDIDEFRERAHRHLMRAHYLLGQRGCALRQYRRCEEVLHSELDAAPARATRQL